MKVFPSLRSGRRSRHSTSSVASFAAPLVFANLSLMVQSTRSDLGDALLTLAARLSTRCLAQPSRANTAATLTAALRTIRQEAGMHVVRSYIAHKHHFWPLYIGDSTGSSRETVRAVLCYVHYPHTYVHIRQFTCGDRCCTDVQVGMRAFEKVGRRGIKAGRCVS